MDGAGHSVAHVDEAGLGSVKQAIGALDRMSCRFVDRAELSLVQGDEAVLASVQQANGALDRNELPFSGWG